MTYINENMVVITYFIIIGNEIYYGSHVGYCCYIFFFISIIFKRIVVSQFHANAFDICPTYYTSKLGTFKIFSK